MPQTQKFHTICDLCGNEVVSPKATPLDWIIIHPPAGVRFVCDSCVRRVENELTRRRFPRLSESP